MTLHFILLLALDDFYEGFLFVLFIKHFVLSLLLLLLKHATVLKVMPQNFWSISGIISPQKSAQSTRVKNRRRNTDIIFQNLQWQSIQALF